MFLIFQARGMRSHVPELQNETRGHDEVRPHYTFHEWWHDHPHGGSNNVLFRARHVFATLLPKRNS